jgi:2'-5' RNA ligase
MDSAPGPPIRSFVAILLPGPVRARLGVATAALRAHGARVRWIEPESLHLTLRFLGSVDARGLGVAREALAEAARGTGRFRIALGGLGGFPETRPPRVVWAGVIEGATALISLHARLEAGLTRRGLQAEGRPFHPHVTLGRARDPRGARELLGVLGPSPGGAGSGDRFGEVVVEALHLMRSDLGPGGPRHTVLEEVPLEHSSPVDIPGQHA